MSAKWPSSETDPVFTAGGATDAEVAAAVATHLADITAVHGIADTSALVLTSDARLSDQRVPTDASVTAAKVAATLKPSGSAVGTDESLRRLGTGATHAAAGDDSRFPSSGEKNALAGTTGTPGTTNQYVTTQDSRLSDARTPTAHTHPISDVTSLQASLDAKQDASTAATDAEIPTITSGTANPSATVPNGSTYYQEDAAGQVVAVWKRQSGAWTKVLGQPPAVEVVVSNFNLATSGTATTVVFDTEVEDTDGMWASGAGSDIVCVRAGRHGVRITPVFAANGTGNRRAFLFKNGVQVSQATVGAQNISQGVPLADGLRLAVGDVLTVKCSQSSGGALTVTVKVCVGWERA